MLSIGKAILSADIFNTKFSCDLDKCKGCCCYHGDSGAPLTEEEGKILEDVLPVIRDSLRPEGLKAIEEKGSSEVDGDGDLVTPLIGKAECAYAIVEDGLYICTIERAWQEGKIEFQKPLSCHLFPVRIKGYAEFDAVNYEEWKICRPALEKGINEDINLYHFLRDALIRVYGGDWYKEVEIAASEIKERRGSG